MKMVFLLLNINNSFTKFASADAQKISVMKRHPTPEVTKSWLRGLKNRYRNHELILSSVVPEKTKLMREVFGKDFFQVSGVEDLGIGIDYPRKKQIGADRLANAVAARALYGFPVVVVDFGTALTFDVVNHRGHYAGGAIAPGLNAMTEYLFQKTALLPQMKIREPRHAIGQSTEEAMRVGAVIGYRGLVSGVLAAIRKELGSPKLKVVATGGQAELMARGLAEITEVNPLLAMQGLRMIALHRKKMA